MHFRALGFWGPNFAKRRILLFFFKICKASASKRIIANYLGHKLFWPLECHFLYPWGAMLRFLTSRHVTWHNKWPNLLMLLKDIKTTRLGIFIIFFIGKEVFFHCQHKSPNDYHYVYKIIKEKKSKNKHSPR